MDRIVDIASANRHLSSKRGFLLVSEKGTEVGRVPLDDVAAVLVHGHGATWTANLVAALADRNATLVVCAANHAPVAMMLPLSGRHDQGATMRAQWEAPRPLIKQAWKAIVAAKIRMQSAVLDAAGARHAAFDLLARKVRSGDPENVEAQAARRYWPLLLGPDFRRDREAGGVNAMLNYGYAVLRATAARAACGAGLHPTVGLHHRNRANSLALADDLMEPFRPLVDWLVKGLVDEGVADVGAEAKARLATLVALDLTLAEQTTPVGLACSRLALSLARSFAMKRLYLALPRPPTPVELHAR